MLAIGEHFCGFRIDEMNDVQDVGGRLWRMTYEKNGAELLWLERQDDVKTFVIAFKTLPEDDTGVAHILEHSVLAGSEKYPVKSPFDEMRKSSVRVFMNAMTSHDATYYPFSTRNDADFLNLADVYLDAVFHPLVLKDPKAFLQEGWHYELDESNGDLSVNGVVFNEMKGVFALPERRAVRETVNALFPDTVYGKDSGGRPQEITGLTYERFKAFHRRFYHPSNARIFLDGSVNIADALMKLDAFLSAYEWQEVKAEIKLQPPVEIRKKIPYASAAVNNKSILSFGWSAGTMGEPSYVYAVDILATYLCGSNEAPLKKALLVQKLCKDVSMGCFDYQQIPLFLILKDTSIEKVETIRKVLRETLEFIYRNGVDRKRLLSLIDRDEFSVREMNSGRPKGLVFFSRVLRQWLYGKEPLAALKTTEIYKQLRMGVDNGFFERLIHEQFLTNEHRVELSFIPDPTLAMRQAAEEKTVMAVKKQKMSADELNEIFKTVTELQAYQNRNDSAAKLAKLPRISSQDLSPHGVPVNGTVATLNGVTHIVSQPTADGVFYFELYFPVNDLPTDDLVKLPLFARLYGKLKTSRHSAFELQTLIAATIGRMSFSTVSMKRGRYFKVSAAALEDKASTVLELMKEVLFETKFDDVDEIEKILRQKHISAEREILSDGRTLALRVAKRRLDERWAAADILHGEQQLRWLQNQKADNNLLYWCENMKHRLLKREGLIVSYTDNLSAELLDTMLAALGSEKREASCLVPLVAEHPSAFSFDGDTGFSAWVARLPKGMRVAGPMRVAARILSLEYLHREVREIGGAYGVFMHVAPSGVVECSSYRDPNPSESLKIMNRLGAALRAFVQSGADIDRFVVSTVASMEPYRPPAEKATLFADLFMDERAPEDEERLRCEVLATTTEQLLQFADILDAISPCALTCLVGGEKQVRGIDDKLIQPIVAYQSEN